MTAFENAKRFFETCERGGGWAACKQYAESGARFVAQSEPLADVGTVEGYCEWMKGFATVTAPGATYELHAAAWDDATRNALFFATYVARHTGSGGPVPPTNRTTRSHYVYVLEMSPNDRVARMTKVWNANWAMNELGWT